MNIARIVTALSFATTTLLVGCADDADGSNPEIEATEDTDGSGETGDVEASTSDADDAETGADDADADADESETDGGDSDPDADDSDTDEGDTDADTDAGEDETGGEDTDGGLEDVCGDGIVGGEEACDDAGESESCNADCTLAVCGDGIVNAAAGEFCDADDGSCACGCADEGNVLDSDADGVFDCQDVCNGFDDLADADGDLTPDACDLDCAPEDVILEQPAVTACSATQPDSGTAIDCTLTDAMLATSEFAEELIPVWVRIDLGDTDEALGVRYTSDWWNRAPRNFEIYVTDDSTATPGDGATLAHTGVGNPLPNGSPGLPEAQTHMFEAVAQGRYWYFVVLDNYGGPTTRVRDFSILRDAGCSNPCGNDSDADGINDCFDRD